MDFILEQDGKLVAFEIKAGSQVTPNDAAGVRACQDSLKKKGGVDAQSVLHAVEPRPLDADVFALPWSWMVPKK